MAGDGFVQVFPDNTGKKVDSSELTVGANTVERQRVVLADPSTAAALVPVTALVPAGSSYGLVVRPVPVPLLTAPVRGPMGTGSGQILFTEDYTNGIHPGAFNDGCGSTSLDYDVLFSGKPTVRLDPQGHTTSSSQNSQQLTLGGSPQTITPASTATFVATSPQTGSPTIDLGGGYIVFNTPSSSGSWQTTSGNSCVLAYTSAVISGTANNWTVTFSGTSLVQLPGAPDSSITTQNIGTAVCIVNNPNPSAGYSPNTSGVVFKRRINDQFSGKYGVSTFLRPTSQSSASSNTSIMSVSLYNRDGTNFVAARCAYQLAIGMNPSGGWNNDNHLMWYVTNAAPVGGQARWVPFAFETKSALSQHSFDPINGTWDRAGVWDYIKIIADFSTQSYVSIQVNEQVYTAMAGGSLIQQSSTGAKTMHFSIELGQTTGTRRYWNAAQLTGTAEY